MLTGNYLNLHYIKIEIASPAEILRWSQRVLPNGKVVGEVTKADTINYRTFKPERGGLFCERIFGSMVSGECACGKTRMRHALKSSEPTTQLAIGAETTPVDQMCSACGVQPTDARVRRYRMGCIHLKKPVAHLWYFRNTPTILPLLLNMSAKLVNEIIHFHFYTPGSAAMNNYFLHGGTAFGVNWWNYSYYYSIQDGLSFDLDAPLDLSPERFSPTGEYIVPDLIQEGRDGYIPAPWNPEAHDLPPQVLSTENCGPGAIYYLLSRLDLTFMQNMLLKRLDDAVLKQKARQQGMYKGIWESFDPETELSRTGQRNGGLSMQVKKLAKRLHFLRLFIRKGLRPEWMIVSTLPVLPPELRPMLQLENGRFATSDLNDLYRRLIYRKLRYDKFCHLFGNECMPDLLIRHDLCLLQEAAEAIIDNGRLERPAQRPNRIPFKSLTAIIEGKHGRFRQNLLGKRVDYSGRSVIVVGPNLRLHQCGLPREMAIELFYPFVIQALLRQGVAKNMRLAKTLVRQRAHVVWKMLERIVYSHPVLLNRAPTLHRLGIQAFEPILLSGRAIQLHPLVCPAFNADFDGDQMAVHIPLSLQAQAEARLLMLATNNWLSPATGEPTVVPSQDMILGFYYLTARKPAHSQVHPTAVSSGSTPRFNIFATVRQVLQRYEMGALGLHEMVWVRWDTPADSQALGPIEARVFHAGHQTHIHDGYALEKFRSSPSFVSVPTPPTPQIPENSGATPYLVTPAEVTSATGIVTVLEDVPQSRQFFEGATESMNHTVYLRTTPGRLILNVLIYEKLFL